MAKVGKSKKALIVSLVFVPIILIGLLIVHWFVYPFVSAKPNFADVEAVFNKLQIPSDWQVIEESENRGVAGRQCPIESESMCFHKAKTFKINNAASEASVSVLLVKAGCVSPSIKDARDKGDPEGSRFSSECFAGPINLSATVNMIKQEIYVSASSR